jgi:RHS repeat-associated protein
MIAAEKADARLEFTYDYMGRRVEKKVYTGSTGNWTLSKHLKFVYNKYKLIEELDGTNSDAILRKYIWSGETPLSVYDVGNTATYYYLHDDNKNVGQLIDSSSNIVSKYEYSPFGKQTVASGSYTGNPFRFSSEYYDSETGLVYYNYRYYSPESGRWTKRDNIEEDGGYNLYGMLDNNTVNRIDYLGFGPGNVKCKSKKQKSDSGWVFAGYYPSSDFASAGTTGGGMSRGVGIIYKRTIKENYSCTCTCPKGTTTKVRTKEYTYTSSYSPSGGVEWAGIPGTWPPLSLSDAAGAIVTGTMTSGIIRSPDDKKRVKNHVKNNPPSNSQKGSLVSDSGIPTRFCLWI